MTPFDLSSKFKSEFPKSIPVVVGVCRHVVEGSAAAALDSVCGASRAAACRAIDLFEAVPWLEQFTDKASGDNRAMWRAGRCPPLQNSLSLSSREGRHAQTFFRLHADLNAKRRGKAHRLRLSKKAHFIFRKLASLRHAFFQGAVVSIFSLSPACAE